MKKYPTPVGIPLLTFVMMAVAILLGTLAPQHAHFFRPLGEIFLSVLKLLVVPLVVVSILTSLLRLNGARELKSYGARTAAFYLLSSALSCGVTMLVLAAANFRFDGSVPGAPTLSLPNEGLAGLLAHFVPDSVLAAFSERNFLEIVAATFFLGIGAAFLPGRAKDRIRPPLLTARRLLFAAIHGVIYLLPLGAFCLVYVTAAELDYSLVPRLVSIFIALGVSVTIHGAIVLPALARWMGGFNAYTFAGQVTRPLLVALTTASSKAALPVSMETMRERGLAREKVVDLVLPLGAAFNMDGSAIFQTLIYVSTARMAGIHLGAAQYLSMIALVTFGSAGVAGIPGGGLAVTSLIFSYLRLPYEYLGIFILADRFWDYPITMMNVWGDLIGAKILDRWIPEDTQP